MNWANGIVGGKSYSRSHGELGESGSAAASAPLAAVNHPAAASVLAALDRLQSVDLAGLAESDLRRLATAVQRISRRVDAIAVNIAGQVTETLRTAAGSDAPSLAASWLREALTVTSRTARGWVSTAAAVKDTITLSGAPITATLPQVGQALTHGDISAEHARVLVTTMAKLPRTVDDESRTLCEKVLVEQAMGCDPVELARIGRQIIAMADPDGVLDEHAAHDRMEFHIGRREANGLTRIWGRLDDLTIEMLYQAMSPLAAPRHRPPPSEPDKPNPAPTPVTEIAADADDAIATEIAVDAAVHADAENCRDWTFDPPTDPGDPTTTDQHGRPAWDTPHPATDDPPTDPALHDTRPAAVRRGHALAEILHHVLNSGRLPAHGGQRPHITVTIDHRDLLESVGAAHLDFAGPATAGTIRRLACDAQILPIVLGGPSQVLDIGRTRYTFPHTYEKPSPSATAAAPGPAATAHPHGPTSTTSNGGNATSAPPASTTAAYSAKTTTSKPTATAGPSASTPTGGPPHPTRRPRPTTNTPTQPPHPTPPTALSQDRNPADMRQTVSQEE